MRLFLFAVICVALCSWRISSCDGFNGKIAWGEYANLGDFPHHLHLQIYSNSNLFVCGGSLIKYNWALTAAQCVNRFEYIQVFIGLVNRENGPIQHILSVKNEDHVRKHPDYNPPSVLSNDIALIFLSEAMPDWLSHPYIGTIELPKAIDNNFVGEYATATGFGLTSDDQNTGVSLNLKFVQMPVIANEICAQTFGDIIIDSKLCTNTSNGSTCAGDEGSGLFIETDGARTLIGIVSFRSAMGCTVGHPAVFTRVTDFVEWIHKNIENPPDQPEPPNDCNCDCNCYTCPVPINDQKREL